MNINKYKSIKIAFIALIWLFSAFLIIPNARASEITANEVIALVNQDRQERNLDSLVINEKLDKVAEAKAQDMINNNYFAHTSPAGIDPWYWFGQIGYDYQTAGENLAMDFLSAEREQKAWMASETHQRNILNSQFQETGIAVKQGKINGKMTTLVVEVFGSRTDFVKSAVPKIEPVASPVINKDVSLIPALNKDLGLVKNLNVAPKTYPDWNLYWIADLSYFALWAIILAINPIIIGLIFFDFIKKSQTIPITQAA